jgi:phosphatidate cytidylyltransferase
MTQRILTAAVLIPMLILAIFVFPLPVFLCILSVLLVLGLRELGSLLTSMNAQLFPITYLLIGGLPWVMGYRMELLTAYLLLTLVLLLLSAIIRTEDLATGLPSVSGNVFAVAYLGLPLSLLALFHPLSPTGSAEPGRAWEMLLVMMIVWGADAAAYFAGRTFGRHKVTPHLSPKKSAEGFAAGLLLPTLLVAFLGGYLVQDRSTTFLLVAAVVVVVSGAAGDLFESMLKRGAGIKDTSDLLPGHGGILDRIDSILFAFPCYYLLMILWETRF